MCQPGLWKGAGKGRTTVESQLVVLERCAATAQQVEDQHYERNDDQQVDKVSTNAADETQQPQNENYYEDSPKHKRPPV